jgi:hypothetical protein
MRLFFILFLLLVNVISSFSQESQGTVLVVSNINGKVLLDGTSVGENQANVPFKVQTTPGEHYIQVQGMYKGKQLDKGDAITVESNKQKIVKWMFDEITNQESQIEPVNVADLNINIPGTVTVVAWNSDNPDGNYSYPTYYYAFEKGDEVTVDLTMSNKNGTNALIVSSYPSNVVKYSNKAFTELKDIRFKIDERTILKFVIYTNHAFDRNGFLKIKRIPGSKETVSFNTNVTKQKIYKPKVIVDQQELFVNSGSNATFKGGKSRIIVPVNLPKNTVEWYYRFSAFRNAEDVSKAKGGIKLFSELVNLTLKLTGVGSLAGKATSIAIDQLSQPPGNDYCDIYLLTFDNTSLFEAKTKYSYKMQGTRENFKSGNVKIDCCTSGNYYLGIKNPDSYYGINVIIEVVAITMTEDYKMEQKD